MQWTECREVVAVKEEPEDSHEAWELPAAEEFEFIDVKPWNVEDLAAPQGDGVTERLQPEFVIARDALAQEDVPADPPPHRKSRAGRLIRPKLQWLPGEPRRSFSPSNSSGQRQELTASEATTSITRWPHSVCQLYPAVSPDVVTDTDCIELVTSTEDPEGFGHQSSGVGAHKEADTTSSVRGLGHAKLQKGTFVCDFCKRAFTSKSSIVHHVFTHIDGVHPPSDICRHCGYVSSSPGNPTNHTCTRTTQHPHLCDFCGKTFRKKAYLTEHIRTHTGERPFTCDTCGKSFTLKTTLRQHRRIHSGERPYGCERCGKSFSCAANLKAHIRIHTGEQPYTCATCGKSFTQCTTLAQHVRTHTGEKPYCCRFCGKAFRMCTDLKQHIRTHTGERPYPCVTCGKRFVQKGSLKLHVRTHTGEQPFACVTCGNTFKAKGDLKRHVRVHTGERPYGCDVCGKAFNQSTNLNTHRRRAHAE